MYGWHVDRRAVLGVCAAGRTVCGLDLVGSGHELIGGVHVSAGVDGGSDRGAVRAVGWVAGVPLRVLVGSATAEIPRPVGAGNTEARMPGLNDSLAVWAAVGVWLAAAVVVWLILERRGHA